MNEAFIQSKAREMVGEVRALYAEVYSGEVKDGWATPKSGTDEKKRADKRYKEIYSNYMRLLAQLKISYHSFKYYVEKGLNEKWVEKGDGEGE